MTTIEWTDRVWNPVIGCTAVSPGCANCYAVNFAHRHAHNPKMGETYQGLTVKHPNGIVGWTGKVKCLPERLEDPLRWKKPSRIFVNSMSDLFHPDVPFEFILDVWWNMDKAHWHIFQVLTKRPERAVSFFNWIKASAPTALPYLDRPLPNVWLGTSVENQAAADERIPHLLATPAAVRFLSCEPLLGPVEPNLIGCPHCGHSKNMWAPNYVICRNCNREVKYPEEINTIDWVIVGGESGPKARPMHPDWARSLRDQCADTNVPFFFKQWGEWLPWDTTYGTLTPEMMSACVSKAQLRRFHPRSGLGHYPLTFETQAQKDAYFSESILLNRVGKAKAGRLLDGQEHNAYPE